MNDEPFFHMPGVGVPNYVRRGVRYLIAIGSEGVVEADNFHEYKNLERLALREGTEGTQEIGREAFRGCRHLRRVDSTSSLRTIGDGAFYGCQSLSEMDLPAGLQRIGFAAFWGHCFRQITIPSSVVEIGGGAFGNGQVLSKVTLEGGTVMVGRDAFYGCRKLRNIATPWEVIVVEDREYGNSRAAVVTGGTIALRRGQGPTLLILTSPYLASMKSADVARVKDAINRTIGGRPRGEGPLDLGAGNPDDRIRVCEGADRIRSRFHSLLLAHRRAIASMTLERAFWESGVSVVEPGVVEIILSFLGDVEGRDDSRGACSQGVNDLLHPQRISMWLSIATATSHALQRWRR